MNFALFDIHPDIHQLGDVIKHAKFVFSRVFRGYQLQFSA